MSKHQLRIHGDNILECENALKLLSSALNSSFLKLISGPAYAPIYEFESDNGQGFTAQLFPGYGRWNFPLVEHIASLGGTLREAPDVIITRVEIESGKYYERPILALEFCGALPAGNNAWQRTGRALALAYAGIPYLYFAELGGQELDATRTIKAARFPNPLVPFAYAVLGANSKSVSLPIYIASPSIDQKVVEIFKDCFGTKESIEVVRGIILSSDFKDSLKKIENKVLKILEVLSQQRKRADILNSKEWAELYMKKDGIEKIDWLIKKSMPWNKKTGIKSLTASFKQLLMATNKSGAVAIGSKDMPICIIPANKRHLFAQDIAKIYKVKISQKFIQWLSNDTCHLLCVWVAGFKPRGDDSRPDRGLVPLARMIFGIEGVDLLTIIYGPAKKFTWLMLERDMVKLAIINGLWEAIINLSNAILVDSSTSSVLKEIGFLVPNKQKSFEKKLLPAAIDTPNFGEHDIDTVLHLLFSKAGKNGIYESMCNPPGGDWSGINIFEPDKKLEFRWTSLPRVSGTSSKRPDHLIQFFKLGILLSIESKDTFAKLEKRIGPRLSKYVDALLNKNPIAFREHGQDKWMQFSSEKIHRLKVLSGVAFRFQDEKELSRSLTESAADIVFGVEFNPAKKMVIVHISASKEGKILIKDIEKLADQFKEIVLTKIH